MKTVRKKFKNGFLQNRSGQSESYLGPPAMVLIILRSDPLLAGRTTMRSPLNVACAGWPARSIEFIFRQFGQTAATTVERWSAQNTGELADQGRSNLAQQLSDSRQRARRSSDESSWSDDEDDEDEENKFNIEIDVYSLK